MSDRKSLITGRLEGVTPLMAERGDFERKVAPGASPTTKPSVDGRTLRRTGRCKQFSMKVSKETHARFWHAVERRGFTAGEQFLIHLLDQEEGRG